MTLATGCGRIGFGPVDDGDAGPAFRRKITIENLAAASLPAGYTVRVDLVGVDDPSGVRVLEPTMPSTDAGVDRLVEPTLPGPGAVGWFALQDPIPVGGQASYWLHDGGGSPAGDATRVFPLFDAFTTAPLSTTWSVFGTPDVSNGLLLPAGDHAVATMPGADDIGATSVFEARMTVTNPTDAGNYFWIGHQHTGDFGTGAPFINWVGEGPNIHGWVNTSVNQRCADLATDGAPHIYRIERGAGLTRYHRDGVELCQVAVDDSTDYAIQLRNQSPAAEIRIDWVRVRNLIAPEPSVVLGAAEPVP